MASVQLTLKDHRSSIRLRRQRQNSALASITHLLRQPGLTVKKTTPGNLKIIPMNIVKKSGIIDEKKTPNNVFEKTPNNVFEKTTGNIAEVKTVNVIDKLTISNNISGIKIGGNIDQTKTPNNILRKKPVINIGRGYTVNNIGKNKPDLKKTIANLKQRHKEKNRVKKVDVNVDTEFYPDKIKRKYASKKIVLKPKHEYHVIATTNKRKRCTPVRDTTSTKRTKPPSTPPKMDDDLVIHEDLTDEDLMEILTCESPVWWEDPPDEGFDEEPIGRRTPPSTSSNSILPQTETLAESSKTLPLPSQNTDADPTTNVHKTQQVKEKRSKLERLLNNIKELKVKVKENGVTEKEGRSRVNSTDSSDISICDDDLVRSLESIVIPIKNTKLEHNEKVKNNDKQISDEKDTKVSTLKIKDKSIVENPLKTKNIKKGKFKIVVENKKLVKEDTTIPIIEVKDDDFETEIPKTVIENKISIKKVNKTQNSLIKVDQNKCIPELNINKPENTIAVAQGKKLLKKQIKQPNSETKHDQTPEVSKKEPKNKLKLKTSNQIPPKKDTKSPISEIKDDSIEKNLETSNNKPNLETKDESLKEIPPKKDISYNFDKQIEDLEVKLPYNLDELPTARKSSLSPRKKSKRSPKKIKITKFNNSTAKCPKILRKNRNNCIYVHKINSNVDHNEITKNISNDIKSNNNRNKLSQIRLHYLDLLRKRGNELSKFNKISNTNNKLSINDNNKIIDKETCIKDNNTNCDNDFCIQNTSLQKSNNELIKNHTNTSDIETNINFNNMKTDADSSINFNNTPNIIVINTNDTELSINCNNINSDNSIKVNNEIPLNLPKLIKIPNNLAHSPLSVKSINSDSTDIENYTISDSNVTYIDEYDEKNKNEDLVTVYKILPRNEKDDEKSPYLNVPGGNMKYCYECSTIFDTENCLYCVKKSIQN